MSTEGQTQWTNVSSMSHSQWRHIYPQLHSKTRLSRQYLPPIRLYNLHPKLAHHPQYLPQSAFVRTFSRGPGRGGAGGAAGEMGRMASSEDGENAGGRRDGEDASSTSLLSSARMWQNFVTLKTIKEYKV
jgi:hypothetical protein